MTVGVAYRVPGLGAVLVSDGRVTESGALVSDSERKYIVCGATAVLVAGVVGQVWRQLQEKPPRNFGAFRETVSGLEDETDWIAYDRRSDQLWLGDARLHRLFGTLGTGAGIALGALDVLPAPKTLEDAERAAIRAVAAAVRHNVLCGGRVRVLRVPRRGPITAR